MHLLCPIQENHEINLTASDKSSETMSSSANSKFISTYLDSPIIQNERDDFLHSILRVRSGEKHEIHPAKKRKILNILAVIGDDDILALDPDLYPSLDNELEPTDRSDELTDALSMGRNVFNQASDGARAWGSPAGLGVDMISDFKVDNKITDWYNKMRLFEEIINILGSMRAKGGEGLCKCRSGNMYFLGDEYFGVIKLDQVSDWYIVSYTQLLMLKDMYYGRFNALIAAWQIYRSVPLLEAIKDCLEWFFKCIAIYGNKGYGVGKTIEALAKANLIRRTDPFLGENGSYDEQLNGVRNKEKELGRKGDFLADELDLILRRDLDLPELVELFGLQKLSGHPLIDPEVGGRSVKEEARKKIDYKLSDVRRLRNNCCRLYLEGYIRKERKWPPLRFTAKAKSTKLYQLYSLEERNINRNSYPLGDWEEVRFEKHLEFEYYPNFTDLMDDKAISFYRDEAAATWDSKMQTRSHKRLLLEMLSRPEISIREIVERVRQDDIPFSWFIVSLYPKEREFKIAARMFSMMVFEMRAYFTATEANIADQVFPSLPQQTMTLCKQEIQELFHKITEAPHGEDLERLFLEIDLTRWNLRWHPEVVDPVAEDLNDMFGLPGLFTALHHFFARCMILVRVPVCEPRGIFTENPPETDLLFYNHEVGFEGIGQKPWTFLTYSMIDLGAGDLTDRYYLIGQADNQIVLMSVDCSGVACKATHLREITATAKRRISEECAKVGQEAKPDECLESTRVVTYSKDVYIIGVEYFTSVKAHSRIFPHSSSDFPSIDGSIGSISGQCLSAAERTKEPMNCFALWCFHAALYLYRLKRTAFVETSMFGRRLEEILTNRVIYGLLILPSDLGGTQTAPVTSFFYKGGADPLSKSYSSLKFYQKSSGLARKFIYSLQGHLWLEDNPNLDLLLEDPYSIPLDRPTTAENSILLSSKAKVNGLSRNLAIKELTDARIDKYGADLRELLISCRPFNPVLLSDALGWSVVGAQAMISKMFTSTRTVQALLQGEADLSVCSKILASGAGYFSNVVSRIDRCRAGESRIESIYRDIKGMRARWGRLKGVEISGVTSYVPFDLPLIIGDVAPTRIGFKSLSLRGPGSHPFHSRGEEDPYIGRSTVEKRSEHGFKITTSSAPERAVKRLADIATQPGVSISFKNLISSIARSRADIDLSEIYPLLGTAIGGTISHRYASRLGMRSASGLGTLSFASLCFLVNDDAYPISGGEQDVAVMVQEMMVSGISILGMNRRQYDSALFCTLSTDSTTWEFLPDEVIEVSSQRDLETPFLRGNILATAQSIELVRTHGPHDSPFTGILGDLGSSGYSSTNAIRRLIGRALESSHSALAIADQGRGVIRFKIDLMELRGIGIETLLGLVACEVALTAVESTFARSRRELRWTPVPMISTLSEAFASCLTPMILHPMFREDSFVTSIVRPSPLKYNFSNQGAWKRVRDKIARESIQLFVDPASTIYTESEMLFSDDKEGMSSRIIVRRFKSILMQGILSGQCPLPTAINLLRVQIPKSLRSESTEGGRLRAFYRLCVYLMAWAEESNLPFLHEQLASLCRGERIRICKIPAQELIREARAHIPIQPDTINSIVYRPELPDEWIIGAFHVCRDGGPPLFSLLENGGGDVLISREAFHMTRLQGRSYGRESSAGYSYMPIASYGDGKVCVVVGCGYGSGAATLLKHGAEMVFGMDLWSDCEERSAMAGFRLPPAISHTGFKRKFVRIETNPRETGDIRVSSSAQLITSHLGEGCIYFIDVPIYYPSDLTSIITTCSLLRGSPLVLIRVISSLLSVVEIYSILGHAGMEPQVHPVFCHGGWIECWIKMIVPSVLVLKGVLVQTPLQSQPVSPLLGDVSFLGGGVDDLVSSIEGPYYSLASGSLVDGVLNMNEALDMSVGDLDHRFTYRQWTELIHILVFRDVLASDDPLALALSLTLKDTVQVALNEHTIPVAMSLALKRMLSRVVPRLC